MTNKTENKKENTVILHKPKSKPVEAEIVTRHNENNYDLQADDELIKNVIRKENCNFNQLDNLNYFTELSE